MDLHLNTQLLLDNEKFDEELKIIEAKHYDSFFKDNEPITNYVDTAYSYKDIVKMDFNPFLSLPEDIKKEIKTAFHKVYG